ncbi:hypothetical protein GIB67_042183 [Kingdonia uniflora]|uniref:CWZF3/5/7 THD domain-containing protein n=1 Tax=Kingdonia uniflora TaxID=39325 RepID=A0A7J7NXM7_9MAGN|nr:hypothetical protein GIB67_042183 [Kingdonia uniflora]
MLSLIEGEEKKEHTQSRRVRIVLTNIVFEDDILDKERDGGSDSISRVMDFIVGLSEVEEIRFVAHEYEKCKEMASAALAYKCMEVAYMRVVYSKHSSVNKDRVALEVLPPGESSSSSASDVDNLNNQGLLDKAPSAKGVSSPHIAGNHVIVAKNRPNFMRLLNFMQDVNSAMEASKKSRNAFAAASGEGIPSVKRVLDYNYHDVQGLLRLVRLAMETVTR